MSKAATHTDQGRIEVDVTAAYRQFTIRQAASILRRQLPALLREVVRLRKVAARNPRG